MSCVAYSLYFSTCTKELLAKLFHIWHLASNNLITSFTDVSSRKTSTSSGHSDDKNITNSTVRQIHINFKVSITTLQDLHSSVDRGLWKTGCNSERGDLHWSLCGQKKTLISFDLSGKWASIIKGQIPEYWQ